MEIGRRAITKAIGTVVPEGAYPRNNPKFGIDLRERWDENDELVKREFAESFELSDDEYIDGDTRLIMCNLCKTPRQKFIDACFGWMHLDCDCLELLHDLDRGKERLKEQAKSCRRIAFEEYPLGRKYVFAADDYRHKRASDMARDYCMNFERYRREPKNGLIIFGDVGTGKTFMATAIMNELIDSYGCLVKFVRISELVTAVNDYKTSKTAFDPFKSCAAIVLDDFGTEQPDGNGRAMDAITRFLDFCENHGIPLIVTTNLKSQDFTTPKGDLSFRRVADRLNGRSRMISMIGESRRV